MRQKRETSDADWQQFVTEDAVKFLEHHVYDPETGNLLTLHPEQRRVVQWFTRRDEQSRFLFTDWLYSAPKKSGKTTLCAGLVLWQAWRVGSGQCYVIANDLKQADSRMFRVIEYAVKHHPEMRQFAKVVRYKIMLANNTFIEALPVDPTGEAGMNPTCLAYTEAWGAKGNKAELMWTEAALSPTRQGHAFRLVESYAGHTGESLILERLHDSIVQSRYCVDEDREIYANEKLSMVAYWCTRQIMPWQHGEDANKYYASERATKTESEYDRQHHNKWGSSASVFVHKDWWEACRRNTLEHNLHVVVGIDAAVSGDCFAIVGVTRKKDIMQVKFAYTWTPPVGGTIDYESIEEFIRTLCKKHRIALIAYDPKEMHYMVTRLKRDKVASFKEFNQNTPRLLADKSLHDRIRDTKILHTGIPELTDHVLNANAKITGDDSQMRIIKRSETRKIDACVALSMACHEANRLKIG